MCWSSSASIVATAVGGAATLYAVKKNYPKMQSFTLAFFTLMELLQAVSYIWIGRCDMGGNVLLTQLSLLHIAFQPLVMSAFLLSFLSEQKRKQWFKPAMGVAVVATILLLAKAVVPAVFTVPQAYMCKLGDVLCGTDVCTYRGNWHIAWRMPLLGVIPGYLVYFIPVFIVPILYGSWRNSLYHFLLGPLLANILTTDHNEAPAIWCLFSVALLCGIFFKPIKLQLGTAKTTKTSQTGS